MNKNKPKKSHGFLTKAGRYISYFDDEGEMWMSLFGYVFVSNGEPKREDIISDIKAKGFKFIKNITFADFIDYTRWRDED